MLINLTKSVPLKELCKVTLAGQMTDKAQLVEFTLTQEAMIGFATELLWIYDDINDGRKLIIETHQLKTDPSPSQAVGFYLTPDSPMMVLKINSLMDKKDKAYEYKNWKDIKIREKNINQYYDVKIPSEEVDGLITLEPYELSKKNIMKINIFDEEENNVTQNYNAVIFEINRAGIKEFASMLLVWSDNYKEGDKYILPHAGKLNCGYNLGVILTHDSILARFKCNDLGTAYDYDLRI